MTVIMEVNENFRIPVFTKRISVVLILLVWIGLPSVNAEKCSLPASWDGTWFINAFANSPPTMINSTSNFITRFDADPDASLGECIWSKGDLYIFKTKENCNKCVFINEMHKNVLESREVLECEHELDVDDPETEGRCKEMLSESEIHFSWFRNNYKASDCPFRDVALQFSYKKSGGSNCTSPISHASSCLDRTKLQFQYEACHEVENSEGKELTVPSSLPSKPDVTVGYEVGTSESATCQGLHSPDSGETILHMNIQNVMNPEAKPCSFPSWFASHKWMDMGKTVELHLNPQLKNRSIHIIPKTHYQVAPNFDPFHQQGRQQSSKSSSFFPLSHSSLVRMQKTNISEGNDNHVAVLGKYTVGCKIGEICLHLIRRSEYLLQVYYLEQQDLSGESKVFREKCFTSDIANLKKGVTMISTSGIKKDCPNPGKYSIVSSSPEIPPTNQSMDNIFTQGGEWAVACSGSEAVEIQPSPNDVLPEYFSCMDGWEEEENNVTYTVLEFVAQTKQTSHTTKLSCMISKNSKDNDSLSETSLTVTTQDCLHVDVGGKNSSEDVVVIDETYKYHGDASSPNHHVELIKHGSCVSENESPLISPAEEEINPDAGLDNDNASDSKLKHSNNANSAATSEMLPMVHAIILISLTGSILLVSSH